MARVTLLKDADLPEGDALIEKMRAGRRGNLLNIYRMLLNSPPLAESWFGHMNAVRWGTELPGRLRELVIIRVGYLLNAAYMLRQHVPKLAAADGVSEEECEALKDWRSADCFSETECAVLAYVDAVTKDAKVDDATYEAVAAHFPDRQMVEITVLIGSYNMHGRVMAALEVDLETDP